MYNNIFFLKNCIYYLNLWSSPFCRFESLVASYNFSSDNQEMTVDRKQSFTGSMAVVVAKSC